jgi:hypothetical protein
MKSPTHFSVLLSVFFAFNTDSLFCQTEFPLRPVLNYTNGFINAGTGLMEIGLKMDTVSYGFLKFGARIPALKDDKNSVQIDKSTDNFNFFIGNEFIKDVPITKNNCTCFLAVAPSIEWGMKKFTYFPDTNKSVEKSDWKHNWAGEIRLRYYFSRRKSGAWQWGIYARMRISRSFTASDAIHVFEPSNNLVSDFVVSSAKRIKMIAPAVGFQVYPGTALPISFSPIVYYYWIDQDNTGGYEKEKLRTEEWICFYPIDKNNLGLRIGFGVSQDYYPKGQSTDRFNVGVLVGIKMDTNIMQSVF